MSFDCIMHIADKEEQESGSRAVTRKPHDAAAVLIGLKFTNNICYKFKE